MSHQDIVANVNAGRRARPVRVHPSLPMTIMSRLEQEHGGGAGRGARDAAKIEKVALAVARASV
eukprot:4247663-Pleurochrysis_carterae.AAC.1